MRTRTPLLDEKILEAAGRLFGTQRFHEVRMDDIAAAAAVSKDTLYRYFTTKEELYLGVLGRASHQFTVRLQEEAARAESPRSRLEVVVATVVTYFDEQPHLLELIQRAEVTRPAGMEFPWQKARTDLLRLILDLFEEAKARGDFAVRDPDLAVLLLLGGLRSVIRLGKRPRPRDLARRVVINFLQGANVREKCAV